MTDRSDYLPQARLQKLAKEIDPKLNLEQDAVQVLQDVADDFVENLGAFACELAKHRNGTTLEARDVQLALGALAALPADSAPLLRCACSRSPCPRLHSEKNWGMRLVGVGDSLGELKNIHKTRTTEVHKTRLQDVRKSKLHTAHR